MVVGLAGLVAGGLAATGSVTVRRGDTLWELARSRGVSVAALTRANHVADPDRIFVGQVLVVPGARRAPATRQAPAATAHIVRPGETLAGIAQRYGTTVVALARANGIVNPNH